MKICVLFSLDSIDTVVTEEEMQVISSNNIEFKEITRRNGRSLFEAVIPSIDKIQLFQYAYAARNPVVIGAWNPNGFQFVYNTGTDEDGNVIQIYNPQPSYETITNYDENGNVVSTIKNVINDGIIMYPFNEQEYLDLQPDKVTIVENVQDPENPSIITSRYSTPQQVDKYAGWEDKEF